MKVMEVAKKLLLEERVQLNLIERWHDSGCFDNPMQMFRLEVRNTYRANPTRFAEFAEGFPGFDIEIVCWRWPMDQQKVEVVESEGFE